MIDSWLVWRSDGGPWQTSRGPYRDVRPIEIRYLNRNEFRRRSVSPGAPRAQRSSASASVLRRKTRPKAFSRRAAHRSRRCPPTPALTSAQRLHLRPGYYPTRQPSTPNPLVVERVENRFRELTVVGAR